jgi:hypothetical protein
MEGKIQEAHKREWDKYTEDKAKKQSEKIQTVARKVRGENKFQRPVIIAPPSRHYARRDDTIRNQLEAIQEQRQRGQLEFERVTKPPKEKIQTLAREKGKVGRPKGSTKSYNLKSKIRQFANKDRSIEGPSGARWASFGTLPEYKPPNFQLDKSGYKPLDYKPIDNAPMFKPTGFKTMDYKPISAEPYYKPSGVGTQPYYRKSEYVPIGQFGGGSSSSISEPRKQKKKKSKEPRLVGE